MPPDRNEIIARCADAARRGDAEAQFQLGVLHCTGTGVRHDLAEAIRWYRRAAEQGHGYAAHNLAVMSLNGNGTEPDAAEGFRWSARAAQAGVPEAQLMLGELYAFGLGTAADPDKARQWFAKAAAQGNPTAVAKLQALGAPPDASSAPAQIVEALPEIPAAARIGSLAIVTMVYNESFNLPIWIRHYRRIAPSAALFVIDHGSDDGSTEHLPGVSKIPVPRDKLDEIDRVFLVSSLQHGFLRYYDVVIYTDCDELLVPDPAIASTLDAYLSRTDYPYASPIGLNLLHMIDIEPPLDLTRPILRQRRYCQFASQLCKPVITRVPVNWQPGFHSCDREFHIDRHLYLFHLKQIDKDQALRRLQLSRTLQWSKLAIDANHWGHHRFDDERFLREFFIDPSNELKCGLGPFTFEVEIAKVYSEAQEISGAFHLPGFRSRVMEIPERFRSVF